MNIVSPKLDEYLSSSVPMLSVSDAEHGVTHDSCTSGTAAAAVSTTRLRSGHMAGGTRVCTPFSDAEHGVTHDSCTSGTAAARLSNKFWAVSFYSFNRLKNKLKK